MTKLNIDDDQYTSPEEITVDSRLKWLLELSAFPAFPRELEHLEPIRHVHPCPWCREPVARVRLGHEVRTVDAIRDELRSSDYARAWLCNVLAEHTCSEVRQ
jgi:hypothetical protein